MNKQLKDKLIKIAEKEIKTHDPSHDFSHAMRVLNNAEKIAKKEKADLDVIIPAALFHDVIVYPKYKPESKFEHDESAEKAGKILSKIKEYPNKKIELVKECIRTCSFSKGIKHEILEAQVLQDSDGLEATGAVSIMRTYGSSGNWSRPFYNLDDPFCKKRKPDAGKYALDLFYVRLLKVKERMYTKTAKRIAKERTDFLRIFLKELEKELKK